MFKYYFFSAFDIDKGFIDDIINHLKADIKNNSLVFVPAMFETEYYVKVIIKWFEEIGMKFEEYIT